MKFRLFRITAIAFLLFTHARLCRAAGTDIQGSLRSGLRERTYLVHLPPQYDGKHPLPLILALHGGGGNGERMGAQTGLTTLSDREGFIVVYPDGTGRLQNRLLTWNAWNCCGYAHAQSIDDVAFFRALLLKLRTAYRIDGRRVFVTGLSNGGMMTYRLACELSDQIAAIAPVAGALNGSCTPSSPVSVIIFHGTEDEHVLFAGGAPRKTIDPQPRIDSSVASAVAFWTRRDGCKAMPRLETRGDSAVSSYTRCLSGTEVDLFAVQGQGHCWPGGRRGAELSDPPSDKTSASELMWAFFQSHPKR